MKIGKVVLAGLLVSLGIVYVNPACLAEEKGLIFYVPFEGNSQPEIGKGALSEDGLEYVEGKKGKAVKFGKGAKLTYPAAGNFSKESGTIELWLYWPEDRSKIGGNLFSLGKAKTPNSFLVYHNSWEKSITLEIYDKQGRRTHAYVPVASWLPGEWHHIAVTYSGISSQRTTRWSVSVDGACLDLRKGKIEIGDIPAEICIGQEGMVIDELKVYNYAKSSTQIWQEIRPQVEKKVFQDSGSDKVVSRRKISMPFIDMGSYVLGGSWEQCIIYKGNQVLDGLGRIALGKDASGKDIDSHMFRRAVEVVEYEDGHCEIIWKANVEKAGFEYTGKTLLLRDRIKYSIDYSFSEERGQEACMNLHLGGLLGASYEATDMEGNVSEGKLKLPKKSIVISKNPSGRIEITTEKLSKIALPGRTLLSRESESENILENGSFEEGQIGRMPPGWSITSRGKYLKDSVYLDNKVTLEGNSTLKMESVIDPESGKKLYPGISSGDIPIEPGHTYEFSVWVKADRPEVGGYLQIDGWIRGQAHLHWRRGQGFSFSEEWKKYSVTATIPGTGTIPERKSICVMVYMGGEGTIWMDNASFVEVGGGSFQTASTEAPRISYDYVPRDQMGDFNFFVDRLRTLKASYKGISVICQLGEIFGPIPSWPFVKLESIKGKKNWIKCYCPTRDIMVKVDKKKDRTTYIWGLSNYDMGYRQINRIVVTPEMITSDISIQFTKKPPKEVIFHPVLFPGYDIGYNRGKRETAILDREHLVRRKDGTEHKKVYPDKKEDFQWLGEDTKEVIFNLPGKKMRFGFSSNDAEMTLSLLGNCLYPPTAYPKSRRAVVCTLKIHPVINKVMTIHTEIAVGEKADDKVGLPEEVPFGDELILSVERDKASGIYLPEDKINLNVNVDNRWNDKDRDLTLDYEVINYDNEVIYSADKKIKVKAKEETTVPLVLSLKEMGLFNLRVKAFEDKKEAGRKLVAFTRVPHPADYPPDKSFFGAEGGYGCLNRPGGNRPSEETITRMDEFAEAYCHLGVKMVRIIDHNLKWENVEKEEGKFTFGLGLEILADVIHKNKMELWISGCDFTGHFPEWAKKKYPEEEFWSLYENYLYEVAKHFKGKVKYYEVANEPHPLDHVRSQFLRAFSKGVKKADPEIKVIDCSTGVTPKCLDETKKYLAHKDGYKYVDIIAPHYLYSQRTADQTSPWSPGLAPEKTPSSKYIKTFFGEVISKYNKTFWNGEDGKGITFHNMFPHHCFYPYQKDFVNINLRSYLLEMLLGVEHNSLCHAATYTFQMGTLTSEYVGYTVSFWGTGGNVLPWGAAHANLAALFDGAKVKEKINLSLEDIHCLLFEDREGLPLIALWSVDTRAKANIPISPSKVKVISVMGKERKMKGRSISFGISPEPVYIKWKRRKDLDNVSSLLKKTTLSVSPEDIIHTLNMEFYKTLDDKRVILSIENKSSSSLSIDALSVESPVGELLTEEKIKIRGREVKNFELSPTKLKSFLATIKTKVGGKSFSEDKAISFSALESLRLGIVRTDTPPSFTGNLNDYKKAIPIVINKEEQIFYAHGEALFFGANIWGGPEELSATAYLLYDKDNFYFACKVTDDKYVNRFTGRDSWNGDSIQIAFDTLNDTPAGAYYDRNDHEINMALTKEGPYLYRRSRGFGNKHKYVSADGPIPGARLKITRLDSNTLLYESAIPFKELAPLSLAAGKEVRFNFIVNDDDGSGRNKWMGITLGIGECKDPTLYKKMIFLKSNI